MYLSGVPCHVIQRGNNREACFFAQQDYLFYLSCLGDACYRYHVAVHAYVLMTNHVHLLMTPEDREGISRVMQSVGRRYVQYINKKYQRCGTLWESRHKASLVDAERYLLTCYRYIELNPVAANMVTHPVNYTWSSYRHNVFGETNPVITHHDLYRRLGVTEEERRCQYRALFSAMLAKEDIHTIQSAARFSMPVGDGRFKTQIERALGFSIGQAKRGRPFCESREEGGSDENKNH